MMTIMAIVFAVSFSLLPAILGDNIQVHEKCTKIEHYNAVTRYRVITDCPPDYNIARQLQGAVIVDYCAHPEEDIVGLIPVTDRETGNTYRNIYCAICHGVDQNLTRWQLAIDCDKGIRVTSTIDLHQRVGGCQHTIKKPSQVAIIECNDAGSRRPKRDLPTTRLTKPSFGLGYSTLLNFGLDGTTHFLLTSDEEEYISRAKCGHPSQIFNPFAHTCINIKCPADYVSLNGECVEQKKYVTETKHVCVDYKVGYELYSNTELQPDDVRQAITWQINKQHNIAPRNIMLPENLFENSSYCSKLVNGSEDSRWVDKSPSLLTKPNITITFSEKETVGRCSAKKSTLVMPIRFALDMGEIDELNKLIDPAKANSIPFDIKVARDGQDEVIGNGCIRSAKPTVINLEWCDGIKNEYKNDEFDLLTFKDNIIGIRVIATNKTYYKSEFQYTAIVAGEFWGNVTQIASTCDVYPRIENLTQPCIRMAIEPGEYDLLVNGSIMVNSFKEFEAIEMPYQNEPRTTEIQTVFSTKEYEVIRNNSDVLEPAISLPNANQSLSICIPDNLLTLLIELELWNKLKITQSCSYLHDFGKGSTIAGLVCSGISFVAIVIVLTTYSLFKTLRTLPGVSLMHLCVAIILSQATFTAGLFVPSITPLPDGSCFAVAVLTHYFILSTFMWMNVMAYSSYKAFGADLKTRLNQLNRRHLLLNSAYGWGIPFAIVGCCAILDSVNQESQLIAYGVVANVKVTNDLNASMLTNGIEIQYQSNSSCWIGNSKAALIIFGLPLVYSIAVNLALFIRTCWGMRERNAPKSKPNIKLRRDSGSGKLKDRNDMAIHVRLSAQYGFAWIFAIVIIFIGTSKKDSEAICYTLYILNLLFNILHGCTGLFIFIAFICNRRIVHLYKCRFLKKGLQQYRSNSSQSVFRTSASKLSSLASIPNFTPPDSPTALEPDLP